MRTQGNTAQNIAASIAVSIPAPARATFEAGYTGPATEREGILLIAVFGLGESAKRSRQFDDFARAQQGVAADARVEIAVVHTAVTEGRAS